MSASARMAGLVEAYGQAVHETAQPDSTQADGRVHDDARTALLAAIGELERDRDAQAERLAAFDSCDRARRAAEEDVAALKAEVTRLAGLAREACDMIERKIYNAADRREYERLRSSIPTPDPAAFVAAVDAYGRAERDCNAGRGGKATEIRDAARAALLALWGVR